MINEPPERRIARLNIGWLDMLVYRLFYWRWNRLLRERSDVRRVFHDFITSYRGGE